MKFETINFVKKEEEVDKTGKIQHIDAEITRNKKNQHRYLTEQRKRGDREEKRKEGRKEGREGGKVGEKKLYRKTHLQKRQQRD